MKSYERELEELRIRRRPKENTDDLSRVTKINNCVVYNLMIVCNKVIITIWTQKLFGFSKNRDTRFRFRTNENFEYMSMVAFYVEHTIIVGFRTLDLWRWDSYSQILNIPRWSETVTGNICEILAFWKSTIHFTVYFKN